MGWVGGEMGGRVGVGAAHVEAMVVVAGDQELVALRLLAEPLAEVALGAGLLAAAGGAVRRWRGVSMSR